MSLNAKLVAFSQAVGIDVGELIMTRGVMADLTTTQKGNLVAAINELKMGLASVDLTAIINDNADVGVLNQAWSADKITMRLNQLKADVLNGAPDSMNTLKEISDYLASNDQNINSLLTNLGGTVRYDASQDLLVGQQLQACVNIDVGDPEVDLVSYYVSQKPVPASPAWIVTGIDVPITLSISGGLNHTGKMVEPSSMDIPYYLDVAAGSTVKITMTDNAGLVIGLSDYWINPLQDTGTLAALDQAGGPVVLNNEYTVVIGAGASIGAEGAISFVTDTSALYLRVRVVQ